MKWRASVVEQMGSGHRHSDRPYRSQIFQACSTCVDLFACVTPLRGQGSMSGGSSLLNHPNTWPFVERDCMGLHETTIGSVGIPVHEAGQTSVGMEPSDSAVVDDEEESMLDQGSLVESNDDAESIDRQVHPRAPGYPLRIFP